MSTKEKKYTEVNANVNNDHEHKLVLWNDDVNTFDHVIKVLMEVCGHDPYQAETCAIIAHFKGKCTVKEGSFDTLKPLMTEMTIQQLTVEIK
jgi:ATP-dependent Clp protease adaptor protein ClpS